MKNKNMFEKRLYVIRLGDGYYLECDIMVECKKLCFHLYNVEVCKKMLIESKKIEKGRFSSKYKLMGYIESKIKEYVANKDLYISAYEVQFKE